MRIISIALLLGALGLAACDGSEDVVLVLPQTGTFTLRTVNGQPLPGTVVDSANPSFVLEVLSGTITISPDNTFSMTTRFLQTAGTIISTRTSTCVGTFTFFDNNGNNVTFFEARVAPDCGGTFNGVLTGTRVTTSIRGSPALYTR